MHFSSTSRISFHTNDHSTATSTSDTRGLLPSEPAEIRIPKIDAVSSLAPLGLNPDETVEVPPVEQAMQAGWYRHARTPGEAGPAVVLGHGRHLTIGLVTFRRVLDRTSN